MDTAPAPFFTETDLLLGRDRELGELDAILDRAVDDLTPQLALLQGDLGVGKTRLVQSWLADLQRRRRDVRTFVAAAQPGDKLHDVVGRLLRARFGLAEHHDVEAAQGILRDQCQEVFEDRRMTEILHFLGSFMGIRFQGNPFLRVLEEDPLEHEVIASTLLRRFLETDSRRSPLVLVLEDLHHADDASLDLIEQLGRSLEGARVLLVAISRPALRVRRPGFGGSGPNVHPLTLGPLAPEPAQAFLRRLLTGLDPIPDPFVTDALEMTGGNPLFIKQLLMMLTEQKILDPTVTPWRLDLERFAAAELPLSVEDAINARILSLSLEERQVLEQAATLGNVFWFGALVVLARIQIEEEAGRALWRSDTVAERLRDVVAGLVARDYVMQMPDSWIPGEEELLFQHNLEHETIQATTDPERRKRYHRFAAQWLESRLKEPDEEHLEFLAGHYQSGGEPRRAAFCFIRAADQARAKFANETAIRCYQAGLALLDAHDVLSRMDALHNLGDVCSLVGKNDEALEAFGEMLRLAWLLDLVAKGGAALGRIGRIHRNQGEYARAMEKYQAALGLFQRAQDRRGLAATWDDMGRVHWLQGAYAEALALHQQALEVRRELGDERSMAFTLANIGSVHQDQGDFEKALGCFEQALRLREKIGDRPGAVQSCLSIGAVFQHLAENERALGIFQEGLKIAREIGDRQQQAHLLSSLAETHRRMGARDQASDLITEATDIGSSLGDERLLADCERIAGLLALDRDQIDAGRDLLIRSLRRAEARGYQGQIGAAERALAEIAVTRSRIHEAEERFERAMGIFSSMGNHLEVARCCDAMAALYDSTGGVDKATKLRESAAEIRARLAGAAGRGKG